MKRLLILVPLLLGASTWSAWNGITVGSSTGNVSKFNGVTIGTSGGNIGAWDGLVSPSLTVATPTTSNSGGSCTGSDGAGWTCTGTTTVSMADATGSSTICYTNDGTTTPAATTPGTCSTGTTYSTGISTASTTTYKMLGTKSGMLNSSVATVVYTISSGGNWTLIDHNAVPGTAGSNQLHSMTLNCSGANWYYIVINNYCAVSGTCASPGGHCSAKTAQWNDGSDHTMTLHTSDFETANNSICIQYAENVTGTNGVVLKASTDYGPIWGGCFSGGATSSSLDQQYGAGGYAATINLPAPTQDNPLVLMLASAGNAGTFTPAVTTDYGTYTALDSAVTFNGGVTEGGQLWYQILSGQLKSLTSMSGGSITGAVGTTCTLSGFNNGSSGATAMVLLNSINNSGANPTLSIVTAGSGATSAPTTATLSTGTATSCSGTATVVTTINGGNGIVQSLSVTNSPGGVSGGVKIANFKHQ